jgi:hypothetical protein
MSGWHFEQVQYQLLHIQLETRIRAWSMAVVFVAQGWLRGKAVTTESGETYYSFQGIPYAKPPVGPLRFQVRQSGVSDILSVQSWPGIRQFRCSYRNA